MFMFQAWPRVVNNSPRWRSQPTVPGTQHDVDFMVKDSKRFADQGGGKRRIGAIHYCLFLAADGGGAGRTSPHGSDFFFSASGRILIVDR
jgi:hypothetical protein